MFTEDKTEAMLVLLQIAHLQFAKVTKRLPGHNTEHFMALLSSVISMSAES